MKMRASGGPVIAGQPYIVGEHEPEVFVPDRNGRILNGMQMARAGIGGGAAGGPTNVFNLNAASVAADDLAAEIAWKMKYGGA